MARRGSSAGHQDIYLKLIENFKENLETLPNEELSGPIISQLTSLKNFIENIITQKTRKLSNDKEELDTLVNCPLCFLKQDNLQSLRLHLKNTCQSINDPNLKEGKKISAFQILPSNSIKCNTCEQYFDDFQEILQHRETEKHKSSQKKKNIHYSKFLYCLACQINVPDNIIQFQNHVHHETHVDRCIEIKKLKGDDIPKNVLLKDGILYLWRVENICKCLVCNNEFEMNSSQMDIHRDSPDHVRNLKLSEKEFSQRIDSLKCLVCYDKIVGLIPMLLHLQSPGHVQKVKIAKKPKSPVLVRSCLFCNSECENILALAKHLREDCEEIIKEKGNEELRKNMEIKPEKNARSLFHCMLCGLQTDNQDIFQEHATSSDHISKREKFVHVGYGIVENVCDICQLHYIGSESFADRHRNEHEVANNLNGRERSSRKEKSPRAKSVAREKSPIDGNKARRAKSVVREKSPQKENKVTFSKELTNHAYQQKGKESSALDDLIASVKNNLFSEPEKLKLSKLHPCTEFDKKFLSHPEKIFECLKSLCKISDSFNKPNINMVVGEICKNILLCSSFQIIGSRAYKLNLKDCSLDIFVTYPNLKIDNNPLYDLIEKSLLQEFLRRLEKDDRFDKVKILDNFPIGPLISCQNVDSKINCLISFKNQLVIEKTEILKNQVDFDPRVRLLLLLIKAWAFDKKLIAHDKFSTYSLFMMVIFFLQSDEIKVLPKYSQMTASPFLTNLFKKQGINPASSEFKTKNSSSVAELFMNFLKFYLSFDFKQAISLPFCKVVSRENIPNLTALKNTAICILDVLEPKINLTRNVSETTLNEFLGYGQSLLQALLN